MPAKEKIVTQPSRASALLRQWSDGDASARERFVPFVYQELRRLAHYHRRREKDGLTRTIAKAWLFRCLEGKAKG